MNDKYEINPGILASKLELKEGDIILITVDTDICDIDDAYDTVKMIQKKFPNNEVVGFIKGIGVNKIEKQEYI